MQEQVKSVEELLRQLPPEGQRDVQHFIEFLIAKQQARVRRQPQFDWAGTLKEMHDQYSSVDLQHQLANWRTEVE